MWSHAQIMMSQYVISELTSHDFATSWQKLNDYLKHHSLHSHAVTVVTELKWVTLQLIHEYVMEQFDFYVCFCSGINDR